MYADLHAQLIPILRLTLAQAALPRTGLALDLACGDGAKLPLLAETLGPGVRLVGLDWSAESVRAARESSHRDHREHRHDVRPGPFTRPHPPQAATPAVVGSWWICGDAHALPLRDSCLDAAVCIAALGLLAEPLVALRELRRALRPGAPAFVVTAAQLWAEVTHWPEDLATALIDALRHLTDRGIWEGHAASEDVGGELAGLLAVAGFDSVHVRAFPLEGEPDLARRELTLAAWRALRPLVAPHLAPADLARCDAVEAEVELVPLALVALASPA